MRGIAAHAGEQEMRGKILARLVDGQGHEIVHGNEQLLRARLGKPQKRLGNPASLGCHALLITAHVSA